MLLIEYHDAAPRQPASRREFLTAGSLTALGLSLPQLLKARTGGSHPPLVIDGFGKAKACILLWMGGGPPQHETWDPKPEAPAEIRGEFKCIDTAVPGLHVGELMPMVAKEASRICVLRAMSTGINAHSSSGYWVLTGQPHPSGDVEVAGRFTATDWPCVGAMVNRLTQPRRGLPNVVTIPEHIFNNPNDPWPGQNAGFLGRAWDPWLVACDPSKPDFSLKEVAPPADVPRCDSSNGNHCWNK